MNFVSHLVRALHTQIDHAIRIYVLSCKVLWVIYVQFRHTVLVIASFFKFHLNLQIVEKSV
jgi:hypothetical protein